MVNLMQLDANRVGDFFGNVHVLWDGAWGTLTIAMSIVFGLSSKDRTHGLSQRRRWRRQ